MHGAAAVPVPRDPRKASPLARYALLPAAKPAADAQETYASSSSHAQQSARQLAAALLDWACLFAPDGVAGKGAAAAADAKPAVNEKLQGALLQYARLAR